MQQKGFIPDEIIFAATSRCNLHCPHCFVSRTNQNLDINQAIKFLDDCTSAPDSHIQKIGFSGGEPFLYLEFILSLTKKALEKDLLFDQIITNGDWWKTPDDLTKTLTTLYDAGYDGKIALSWDSYHNQTKERMEIFISTVQKIFGDDSINIQTVDTGGGSLPLAPKPSRFTNRSCKKNDSLRFVGLSATPSNGADTSSLQPRNAPKTYILPRTYPSDNPIAWQAKKWFKEDFCQGPGNILFVHPNGNIAPCCGFANENPALFIGKITDSFEQIMQNAANNKMVKICYEEGLSHYRRHELKKTLRSQGKRLPGKTSDICSFCDFVCKVYKT